MKLRTIFTKSQYAVAYRLNDSDIIDDTAAAFDVLMPNKNAWYADPFIFVRDGEYYVFMEMMMVDRNYACIACSKLVNGKLSEPEPVLDTKSHLSFPFVFERDNTIFMLPESMAEKEIQLYKCVSFPDKWVKMAVINDERALYDSVLFENDGKVYMFTSSHLPSETYGSKLYLMELDNTSGEYRVVNEKLITEDSRNSRQAGKILHRNEKMIRVAQDCSRNEYGRALEFLEIERLDDYSEKLIKHIGTRDIKMKKRLSGVVGVHTYNRENKLDVIDLRIAAFSVSSTIAKFRIVFKYLLSKLK